MIGVALVLGAIFVLGGQPGVGIVVAVLWVLAFPPEARTLRWPRRTRRKRPWDGGWYFD